MTFATTQLHLQLPEPIEALAFCKKKKQSYTWIKDAFYRIRSAHEPSRKMKWDAAKVVAKETASYNLPVLSFDRAPRYAELAKTHGSTNSQLIARDTT